MPFPGGELGDGGSHEARPEPRPPADAEGRRVLGGDGFTEPDPARAADGLAGAEDGSQMACRLHRLDRPPAEAIGRTDGFERFPLLAPPRRDALRLIALGEALIDLRGEAIERGSLAAPRPDKPRPERVREPFRGDAPGFERDALPDSLGDRADAVPHKEAGAVALVPERKIAETADRDVVAAGDESAGLVAGSIRKEGPGLRGPCRPAGKGLRLCRGDTKHKPSTRHRAQGRSFGCRLKGGFGFNEPVTSMAPFTGKIAVAAAARLQSDGGGKG